MRRALSRAALIEKHDAIGVWIVKLPILRHQPATRPAMQKDHRLPLWIAALLIINLMNVRDLQPAGVIGLDWRVKSSKLSHADMIIGVATLTPSQDLKSIPILLWITT